MLQAHKVKAQVQDGVLGIVYPLDAANSISTLAITVGEPKEMANAEELEDRAKGLVLVKEIDNYRKGK